MKTLFFTILFSLTFVVQFADGCSLIPTPLTDFDQSEYIFIGEVVGYTEPLKFKRDFKIPDEMPYARKLQFQQADGLIVKVKDSVHLPETPKSHFEVFYYNLDAGCGTLGLQRDELEKEFPIKSEILVVAKQAKRFPYNLPDGDFRIEIYQGRNGLITLNLDEANQRITSVDSVFDYRKTANEGMLKNEIYYGSKFELRKDLFRLKNAKTQKDRRNLLERISYFSKSYYLVDFYALLKKYGENTPEFLEIYRNYLQLSGLPADVIQKSLENWQKAVSSKRRKIRN